MNKRARNAITLTAVCVVWVALDQLSKHLIDDGAHALGSVVAGPFLGLFDFTLVHNTGGAWGIFSDSTALLGIFSLVVCVLLVVYLLVFEKDASIPITLSVAFVVAGGIGNAIDRFVNGYVIDFIHTTFMEFPCFNVADIGVTCGIAALLICIAVSFAKGGKDGEQ